MRRTKIVCTIGPATIRRPVIEQLLRAGMDVARLNFSHGTHEEHGRVLHDLRDIAARLQKPLAILQDLSGPKVRLGRFNPAEVTIKRGQEIGLICVDNLPDVTDGASARILLPLPIHELHSVLAANDTLLLDDGKLTLKVTHGPAPDDAGRDIVWTRCTAGGVIRPRKGVTAPGVSCRLPAVTPKDLDDLAFGLRQGVDWVAASYVREPADIVPLRRLMEEMGTLRPVIAKIEKWEAVRNLFALIDCVDGIMVARGDLGVEMPFDEVPIVQKRIIRACNDAGKPVITATQMLESMIQSPRPTRAEATDVANAIFDGTDAVMLSGETAVGQYPVESVRTMDKIARRTEADIFAHIRGRRLRPEPNDVTSAVARATTEIAEQLNARAILCATTSGATARKVARQRPLSPILGACTTREAYYQLALTWGVRPCYIGPVTDTDSMMQTTIEAAVTEKLVSTGDRVVLTAGVPVNNTGTTNLIKVHIIGQPLSPAPTTESK